MSKDIPVVEFFNKINPFMTSIIAIVAIAIPVAGFSFEQGYLSVFGLSSESFPRDLTEAWGRSYAVAILVLNFISQYYLKIVGYAIGYIVFLSLIVFFVITYFKRSSINKFFNQLEKILEKDGWIKNMTYVTKEVVKNFMWVYKAIFYFFILFSIAILIIALPYVEGSKIANKHINKFNNGKCEQNKWSYCVQVKELSSSIILHEGYLVAASNSYIALYDGLKTEVIPRLESYSLIRYQVKD